MITEFDKAYAAGFFDGEGCITIEKPRMRRGYTLVIDIGQKDITTLTWLQSLWGGAVKRKFAGRAYNWRCSSWMAGEFLVDIFPYLKGKMEVARLAIELQQTKNHALRATPEYIEWCNQIRQSIMSLNGRS